MADLNEVLKDIKELDEPLKRIPSKKAQVFGNEHINTYFIQSGFSDQDTAEFYYYVIIENGTNPIPPTLMIPSEIKEKMNITIDDYY